MLAFRSLDPFRALREPDRRRRDEERLSRSEQRTLSKTQNNHLTGKAHTSSNPSPSSRESRKLATASAHSNANGTVCALRAPLSPNCLEILSLHGCKEGDQKPEDAAG